MKNLLICALLSVTAAHKLKQHSKHACDFIEESGEDMDKSLNPENKNFFLQTGSNIKFEADGSDMSRAQYTMVKNMAFDLGVPLTPELMQLRSNEEISNKIIEIAMSMGKTEEEIGAALGADGKDM